MSERYINQSWLENETWKTIPNTNGLYEASSFGNVRRVGGVVCSAKGIKRFVKGRLLKEQIVHNNRKDAKPRRIYDLCVGGKRKRILASHCVALAFLGMPPRCLDDPSNYISVNHIDENPFNDRVDNLEWIPLGENISKYKLNHSKQVVVLVKKTGELRRFMTGHDASRFMGKNETYIAEKLKRNQFETDNFAWFIGFNPGSKNKEEKWITNE